MLFKKSARFPNATASALNSFVICISFPAIVLVQIPKLIASTNFSLSLIIPISMAWLLFAMSWVFFSYIGQRRGWSKARIGALILTAGLGNTSFVGLPLLEALYGTKALQWGVLIDQLGSFLTLSTLGLIVAAKYGFPRDGKQQSTIKQIITFPPFIALTIAALIGFSGLELGSQIEAVLEKIGATLVPIALVAVGFQLKLSRAVVSRYWKVLSLGIVFKLFLAPAILGAIYILVSGELSFVTRITIIEAAMATMITSAVVASDFNLDSELANLMVGVSIPISLVTVPLWNFVLNFY